MHPRSKTRLARLAGIACALTTAICNAQPNVVVSIKPLHSLVAGLMTDVGEPVLLFNVAGSPHTLSMRPSQRRALAKAQLVVRVGPGLETVLNRPLQSLSSDIVQIDVIDAPGLEQTPARSGGSWDQHTEHDHMSADAKDPHILLSPRNAIAISRYLVQTLIKIDPTNTQRYQANLTTQRDRINALDAELAPQLESINSVPYLVFHDAYHVFEDHYSLNVVGSFSVAPGRAPGARRLRELQKTIMRTKARCVFIEPQFSPASASQVAKSAGARLGELDPVGATITPGPDHWFTLMRNLAHSLTACLRTEG